MAFTVGDKVKYFRSPDEDSGTVLQLEGGRRGDMTEVFWKKHGQATWMKTQLLVKVEGEEKLSTDYDDYALNEASEYRGDIHPSWYEGAPGLYDYQGPVGPEEDDWEDPRSEGIYLHLCPQPDGVYYWEMGEAGPGGRKIDSGFGTDLEAVTQEAEAAYARMAKDGDQYGGNYGFSYGP